MKLHVIFGRAFSLIVFFYFRTFDIEANLKNLILRQFPYKQIFGTIFRFSFWCAYLLLWVSQLQSDDSEVSIGFPYAISIQESYAIRFIVFSLLSLRISSVNTLFHLHLVLFAYPHRNQTRNIQRHLFGTITKSPCEQNYSAWQYFSVLCSFLVLLLPSFDASSTEIQLFWLSRC